MEKANEYPPSVNVRLTPDDKKKLAVIKRLLPRPAGVNLSVAAIVRTAITDLAEKLQNEKTTPK